MTAARKLAFAGGSLLGLGGAVTLGAWVEARAFMLRRVDVPVLPRGSAELRVLHISDIHQMPYQKLKLKFVASLDTLNPDLVITTGDNISSPKAIDPLLDALTPLLERPGAFVLGSNDFIAPKFRNPAGYLFGNSTTDDDHKDLPTWRLQNALTEAGWDYLDNASARLSLARLTIDLRGTGDAHHGLDDYAAVSGPVAADAGLTVGVTHAPYRRVLDAMTADGVQLIFAGHTHGGQICLPVNRAIVDNCDLPLEQASGLSTWTAGSKTSWLHVSAGVGTSPTAPFRLFCRPGATLLRLIPRT